VEVADEMPGGTELALTRSFVYTDFPGWCDGESVCARCAEMYDAIVGFEYPSTIVL
jgi:hypothetical protein